MNDRTHTTKEGAQLQLGRPKDRPEAGVLQQLGLSGRFGSTRRAQKRVRSAPRDASTIADRERRRDLTKELEHTRQGTPTGAFERLATTRVRRNLWVPAARDRALPFGVARHTLATTTATGERAQRQREGG
jgi:hypothetical protein